MKPKIYVYRGGFCFYFYGSLYAGYKTISEAVQVIELIRKAYV